MSVVGEELASQKQAIAFDENFLATSHQVTYGQKLLFLPLLYVFVSFFSFSFPGLLRPLPQICWPKEWRACLIAQRQWILRYGILKNKKFDVRKLTPKISEEFTIVITWPLQMLGLEESRYAPGHGQISIKLVSSSLDALSKKVK